MRINESGPRCSAAGAKPRWTAGAKIHHPLMTESSSLDCFDCSKCPTKSGRPRPTATNIRSAVHGGSRQEDRSMRTKRARVGAECVQGNFDP